MGSVGAVLLVVALGVPLAAALTRNALLAVLLAPLVTALTAALAVVAMLIVGAGPLPLWMAPLLLAQYALLPRLWRRVCPLPHASWAEFRWLVLPLLPPLLLVFASPGAFDSHSIWWLHAGYFAHGGSFAQASVGSPALQFTHPDYPPLASAPVALVWSLRHTYSFTTAQYVSTLVTFSGVAALAYAVRLVTDRAPVLVSRLAAVAVGLAAWGAAYWAVASGYSDPLWATAFVAAAILLLVRPDALVGRALPILLASVAALTKNEALMVTVLLAALVTARELRTRGMSRRVAWVWVPVLAALGWLVLARSLGATSDITDHAQIGGLFTGDHAVYGRLGPSVRALWQQVGPIVAGALVVAVLGGLFLRRERRLLGLHADGWLWALAVGYTASLLFTYMISTSIPLAWYLATSADRVSLPLALLSATSAACWAVTAVGARTGSPVAPDRHAVAAPATPEAESVRSV